MTKLEYAIEGTRRLFFPGGNWIGFKYFWDGGIAAQEAGRCLIEHIERIVQRRVLKSNTTPPPDPMQPHDIASAVYLLTHPPYVFRDHGIELLAPTAKAAEAVEWLEAIAAAIAAEDESLAKLEHTLGITAP
jgi:hypothetical protein